MSEHPKVFVFIDSQNLNMGVRGYKPVYYYGLVLLRQQLLGLRSILV